MSNSDQKKPVVDQGLSTEAKQALAKFEERTAASKNPGAASETGNNPWLALGGMLLVGGLLHSATKSSKAQTPLFKSKPAASSSDLGALIRNRRKDMNLTQEQLAVKAGVGPRLINEVEQGKDTAEIGKILLVLDALDLELKVARRG